MSDIMNMIDVLVADANNKDNNQQTAFSEFPGEKPSRAALKMWVEKWTDDLGNAGYGPLLRGSVPYDVA